MILDPAIAALNGASENQIRQFIGQCERVRRRTWTRASMEVVVSREGIGCEMIGRCLYGAVRCTGPKGFGHGFACITVGPRGGVRIQHERYDV